MAVGASVIEYAMAIARAGSAAALAMSIGTAPDAANRVGYYSDLTASAEKLGVVVGGITGPTFDRIGSAVVMSGVKLQDSSLQIVDDSDVTKSITFQCASMSSGFQLTIDAGAQAANRTLSVPVLTGNRTIAVLEQAQVFTDTVAASNLSGTNTGDITLGAIGAAPSANGASLSGQVLTLQPASASFGGIVTIGTQSFAGAKTFTNNVYSDGNYFLNPSGTDSRYFFIDANASYAGVFTLQAGGGSAGFGAAVSLYGHSHASYPGTVYLGKSAAATGPALIVGSGGDGITGTKYLEIGTSGITTIYNSSTSISTMTGSLINGGGFGNAGALCNGGTIYAPQIEVGTLAGAEIMRIGGSIRFSGRFTGEGALAATNIAIMNNTSATGYGPAVAAGTGATYYCMRWDDYLGTTPLMRLNGDGQLVLYATTASTSTTTGSLVNPGGFGCAGAAMFGGAAITTIAATEVSIGGGQVRCGDAFFVDNGTVRLYAVLGGSTGYMGTQSAHPFVIRSSNTDRITIESSGDITCASGSIFTISNTTSAATSLIGACIIGNGVAATSIGLGGGNINAGGTLIVGGQSTFNGLVTLADSVNIAANTVTGSKIGTSNTQKIGVWNATPIVQPTAYTQTFATAARTMNAYTSDVESSAYTGIDNAQGGTPYAQLADLNSLRTAYETLRAMADNLQQVVNSLIDDHQAIGLCA